MRVLVLTGSRVIPGLIDSLTPPDVDVESTNTFAEALRQIEESPPDGVVVDTGLCERLESCVPRRKGRYQAEIEYACRCHQPPIPVLVESALHHPPDQEALDACGQAPEVQTLPLLKAELQHLLEEMHHNGH